MHVSIAKGASVTYQLASDMNELTQNLGRIHASIVKSALVSLRIANNMNELTKSLALQAL